MSSIDLVFAHFSDGVRGLPAERLGQAMWILGMNPTEDQVYKHLADLGRPYIDQATFHRFIQDELTKYLEQVQAVVDYLKQYDTDNKGALSTEEVQAAIRGSGLSQKKLQASVAKMPSNSKGQLDIVELATCFLELGDSEEMLEPSEAEKERASASEADSKAVKIQVVKDAVSADAEAGTTDAEQCRETRAAEESASGPAAYSTMFSDVIASTNAVFRYFSQPSGVPAERLGHAMAILGMNPTEDEVKKHLAGLGGPKYIDQKMFHRFIEEELGKLIPKVQELLDYLKQFDTDGKGALSEEELQEVMRGSELSQDKVQARPVFGSCRGTAPWTQVDPPTHATDAGEGHLDIVKLSKYFLELGNSQVEADDSIPGTAKTRQDVASQVREAIAKAADAEARYGLKDPQAFAQFLQDSDVRLVRAKYLVDLVLSKRPLPRRQEAETETFTCGGERQSALVTHKEVQNWAKGTQEAIICSISHAWETREHPDPCRHQLQQIVNHTGLYGAAFEADIWIFYDYSSLFQYERTNSHEERSFRKAMNNMHLMYAHECTLTFRIETLTPEHVWNTMMADEEAVVRVYDAGSKTLKEKPLKLLEANRTPYLQRGWCMAEIEWSSLRGVNAQHQHIDRPKDPKSETQKSDHLNGRVPMIPANFRQQMEQAKFTHRSDADAVIYLQQKIFREKVIECQHLVLEGLPAQEILALARALPHYENLKSLTVRRFQCGEEEATSPGKALASSQVETLEIRGIGESGRFMVKALAETLKTNSSVRDMNLAHNKIGPEGAQALAGALKINSSVRDMNLARNDIDDTGAQAWPVSDVLGSLA
ncbi:unnamed protein product [Cladocopium goreaui]|uniref:Calmodulin n=1 Tax=Cladocopium goreaui TaxID=2562237 RepID=A0A9P1GNE3_9DINO|nr:unnamed protein product [Cladocopium goreaui]